MPYFKWIVAGMAASMLATTAYAQLPDSKILTLDLARNIALETFAQCGARGYHVSVVVVDALNEPMVLVRDDAAPAVTSRVAILKATTAMLYNEPSRPGPEAPLQPEPGSRFGIPPTIVHGTMLNYGGLPIKAGEVTIGAVGLDGAPGGGAVIACAGAALAKVPANAYTKLPDSKVLTLDLARAIAEEAMAQCRAHNFHVGVLVVDAFDQPKALIRDDGAAAITVEVAKLKVRTALLYEQPTEPEQGSGPNSVSAPIIPGTFRGRGGVPIKVGQATIGAVAVSGSPGSANDEACATGALAKLADRLK
jgi:uncharacterized protein GlcG (DUF336 family)